MNIGIQQATLTELGSYVGDLYQSFLVYLTRKDDSSTRRVVTGGPAASGSYSISSGGITLG